VTLKCENRLRGCIGSLQAHRALVEDVKANALAAAFHDPRFVPLSVDEFSDTKIEVSVLSKLAPFPWDATENEHHEERMRNLRALVARARKHGMGVYLYLNEPRTLPLAFFASRPQLKGIDATNPWEAGTATLCTSAPEVQKYLSEAVASICRAVPDLAGFFTITASEALTNCWSHRGGAKLSSCSPRWIGRAHRANDARGAGPVPALSATESRSSPRRNSFPRFRKTLGKSSARRWIHHGIR